jgi:aspartate/methionine/tyrosine aminotransferase
MEFAERVSSLTAEGAYHVLSKAQALEVQGREIIHLEIGQPDVATFPNISQAGVQAIQQGHTRYTATAGIRELRRIIAEDAGHRRGLHFEADQVVVGPGAKPFLFFPTLALVRPGDEVMYPDPGFPTYKAMIEVAGGIPIAVPLNEEDDFAFDLDAFDRLISPRTRMVILNSPSNPTGGVMRRAVLEYIAAAAIKHDFWVLSDEIYGRLVYESPALSIATIPEMMRKTIICDGFSKTYAMTGWRLGFGIMPLELAERVDLLLTHSVGSTASFTQIAGIEAVRGPQDRVEAVVAEYRRRRDALVEGLNGVQGIHCRVPQGAFYVFPNITGLGKPSEWIADFLLERAGVALLPGTSFGEKGEGYLRLCFANSLENILSAIEKIREALTNLN